MAKIFNYINNNNLGLLLIRIALGIVFLYAGVFKVMNMSMTLDFFSAAGISLVITYYVTYVEILAGIALIVGLFTRLAAFLMAINMLYAIKLLFGHGFSLANGGYEYNFVLLLCSLALILLGSGAYAIDYLIRNKNVGNASNLY